MIIKRREFYKEEGFKNISQKEEILTDNHKQELQKGSLKKERFLLIIKDSFN